MDFVLRKWLKTDAESLFKYANNKKIADNLRDAFPFPYKLSDAEEFIQACIDGNGEKQCVRAIAVDGYAVGCIGFFVRDDIYRLSAEIGYWLGEPFWGNGIVSGAISRMCKTAFEDYDLIRVFAEPFTHNLASCKALLKAGFAFEGVMKRGAFKNGKIIDYSIYALLKD